MLSVVQRKTVYPAVFYDVVRSVRELPLESGMGQDKTASRSSRVQKSANPKSLKYFFAEIVEMLLRTPGFLNANYVVSGTKLNQFMVFCPV